MKKLYNSKGPKRVHPSPPSPSPSPPLLSSLPTALLALASTLSPQEQEVLSYLLDSEKLKENQPKSKNKDKKKKGKDGNNYNHAPDLACSCFGCYKSFWARWDASPNRHVIHLILDAFEETLESKEADRRKKRGLKSKKIDFGEVLVKEMSAHEEKVDDDAHDDGYGHDGIDDDGDDDDDGYDGDDGHGDDEEGEDGEGKSSVRRFVSWVFGMNN